MNLKSRLAGSVAASAFLLVSRCQIRDLNRETGRAVTNTTALNLALEGNTNRQTGLQKPAVIATAELSTNGLIHNLHAVSQVVTNLESTLGQLDVPLTNVAARLTAMGGQLDTLSNAMAGLSSPLTRLTNEVNGIRSELTNLHSELAQLGNGLGTLHGQIGGGNQDGTTNSSASGLIGELRITQGVLRPNTLAIGNVSKALRNNNRLLGASTEALNGFDTIKAVLPLLTGMAALMGSLWSAINLGNTARKSAWDKLKEIKGSVNNETREEADGLVEAWEELKITDRGQQLTGRKARNNRNLRSAIMSVCDFRDAYAYSAFQLGVAAIVIWCFFGSELIENLKLIGWLALLFVIGFGSLLALYLGDKHDVKVMFNDKWPLPAPQWAWFCCICPPFFGLPTLRRPKEAMPAPTADEKKEGETNDSEPSARS